MDKIFKAFDGVKKYITAVRTELKRVSWPSAQELRASTLIVLITLCTVTLFLWLCDSVFTQLFKQFRGF
jgi:preprotein translocase subunit SecE